jgi:glycosyltransferase involved in cell wall biosynthesis
MSSVQAKPPRRLVILMPVYDDWESAAEVCRRIDAALPEVWASAHVVLIDDGSHTSPHYAFHAPKKLDRMGANGIEEISVLELRRNLGHQRAIAVALAYVADKMSGDAVIVMDADGEDPPEQIPALFAEAERHDFSAVVFAERGRRVEGVLFHGFYFLYRVLHWVLTGRKIRVGNFSVLPWRPLERLVLYPELWNHYAAAVLQSRLPCEMIRLDRGPRIQGKSKMRFVDLVMHGLSALFAYQDLVATRLLIGNALLLAVCAAIVGALFAAGVASKVGLAVAIVIIAGQLSTISLLAVFLVVMNRSSNQFLPARDYVNFVRGLDSIVKR